MNDHEFGEWIATNYGITVANQYRTQTCGQQLSPDAKFDALHGILTAQTALDRNQERTRFSAIIRPLRKKS